MVLGTILVVSCYLQNSWLESRKRERCCDLMAASLDELYELIQVMNGKHVVESLIMVRTLQVLVCYAMLFLFHKRSLSQCIV